MRPILLKTQLLVFGGSVLLLFEVNCRASDLFEDEIQKAFKQGTSVPEEKAVNWWCRMQQKSARVILTFENGYTGFKIVHPSSTGEILTLAKNKNAIVELINATKHDGANLAVIIVPEMGDILDPQKGLRRGREVLAETEEFLSQKWKMDVVFQVLRHTGHYDSGDPKAWRYGSNDVKYVESSMGGTGTANVVGAQRNTSSNDVGPRGHPSNDDSAEKP